MSVANISFTLGKSRVQRFGYKVMEIEPISALEKYQEHRRLRVYFHKGTECANPDCDRKGVILTHGIDKGGNIHIDLCTADLYPITIDHIHPRSLGGSDDLENLQPMCSGCNSKKGNGKKNNKHKTKSVNYIAASDKLKNYNIEVGDNVFKKITNTFLGKVTSIKPNEKHPNKALGVTIEGKNESSIYQLKLLYTLKSVL